MKQRRGRCVEQKDPRLLSSGEAAADPASSPRVERRLATRGAGGEIIGTKGPQLVRASPDFHPRALDLQPPWRCPRVERSANGVVHGGEGGAARPGTLLAC